MKKLDRRGASVRYLRVMEGIKHSNMADEVLRKRNKSVDHRRTKVARAKDELDLKRHKQMQNLASINLERELAQ